MTEKELLYKVEMLEDLTAKQSNALGIANDLIDLKDRLVRLYEEETEIYKRQNKRLTRSLMISAVLFTIVAVINIVCLLS